MKSPLLLVRVIVVLAAFSQGCSEHGFAAPAPRTVAAFPALGTTIHSEYAAPFVLAGEEVRFTMVEYGRPEDCPSGCLRSMVCAVEDNAGVYPYFAYWNGEDGIMGIDLACAEITSGLWSATVACDLSGKQHPLMSDPVFQEFRSDMLDDSTFSPCFAPYAGRGCLDTPCGSP